MEKLNARIELKMKAETYEGLVAIHKKHRLSPAEVCRALAEAAVEYFQKNGRFGFPIHLSEEPISPTSPVAINLSNTPKDSTARDLQILNRTGNLEESAHLNAFRQGLASKRQKTKKTLKRKPKSIGF